MHDATRRRQPPRHQETPPTRRPPFIKARPGAAAVRCVRAVEQGRRYRRDPRAVTMVMIPRPGAHQDMAVRRRTLAAEDVLEVRVRRHVFTSERPFAEIMDGIYGGISQPDIGSLF